MRKISVTAAVLIMAVLAVRGSYAQTSPTANAASDSSAMPTDAPTRDQVMTLLDLLQVRRNMINMLQNMKQLMTEAEEEEFRKKVPNPTPKQLAALHSMFDDLTDMPLDKMIDAFIPIYQRHLTRSDVLETIRFYSSPTGQKLLAEQPKMVQEGMAAASQIARKRMDEMNAKMHERMQRLIEATDDPGPSKQ